jgi:hypothetical protein
VDKVRVWVWGLDGEFFGAFSPFRAMHVPSSVIITDKF